MWHDSFISWVNSLFFFLFRNWVCLYSVAMFNHSVGIFILKAYEETWLLDKKYFLEFQALCSKLFVRLFAASLERKILPKATRLIPPTRFNWNPIVKMFKRNWWKLNYCTVIFVVCSCQILDWNCYWTKNMKASKYGPRHIRVENKNIIEDVKMITK